MKGSERAAEEPTQAAAAVEEAAALGYGLLITETALAELLRASRRREERSSGGFGAGRSALEAVRQRTSRPNAARRG